MEKTIKTKVVVASRQEKPKASRAIDAAVKALETGGLVIIPTETTYGIAADATNPEAVKRVFELKGREHTKALPIIVGDINIAAEHLSLTDTAITLSRAFHPGPLNIILDRKPDGALAQEVGSEGVAFRISSNYFAGMVAGRFGKPITATSANLSGQPAIYESFPVREAFGGKVEVFLDVGTLLQNPPSTTIDARTNPPKMIREGQIKLAEILGALK